MSAWDGLRAEREEGRKLARRIALLFLPKPRVVKRRHRP